MIRPLVTILNGPNLHKIGTRQCEWYGKESFTELEEKCQVFAQKKSINLIFKQTNCEGKLIDWIHEATQSQGLIINAGAFSHTSVAILDALLCLSIPIYEVHLSQIYKRESFRHHSYISSVAKGIIIGCGLYGYMMALQSLVENDLNPYPGSFR